MKKIYMKNRKIIIVIFTQLQIIIINYMKNIELLRYCDIKK